MADRSGSCVSAGLAAGDLHALQFRPRGSKSQHTEIASFMKGYL
jgi:hypothetical protein